MTLGVDHERIVTQLDCIAWQIRRWLDWHKEHRDQECLVTSGDTHIMGLPVPFWPTHDQFENWIKAMTDAGAALRAHGEKADQHD